MSDETPSDVLGSLPRTRPHRRSTRRAARPAAANGNGASDTTAAPGHAKPKRAATAKATAPAQATAKAPPKTAAKAKAKVGASRPQAVKAAPAPGDKPKSAAGKRTAAGGRPAASRSATSRSATSRRPKPTRLRQPAQPAGTPTTPRARKPAPSPGADVVGTAVQAAAELAEIGLSVSARALRRAVSRLPRP